MALKTQESPPHPPEQQTLAAVDARKAHEWLTAGLATLLDVREPDEHARERIAHSLLRPLSSFDALQARPAPGQRTIIHCKSGRRSAEAVAAAIAALPAGTPIFTLTGGIEAWKAAGLPVLRDARAPRISVMRQVQIVTGSFVLIGTALAWLVHPIFFALSAFFGGGLLFAGLSGTCGMASLLSCMPWNRLSAPPASPTATPPSASRGSCSGGGSCSCQG